MSSLNVLPPRVSKFFKFNISSNMALEELKIHLSYQVSKLLQLLRSFLIYYGTFPAQSSVADPDLKQGRRSGALLLCLHCRLIFFLRCSFSPKIKGEGAGHTWSLRYIRHWICLQMTQNVNSDFNVNETSQYFVALNIILLVPRIKIQQRKGQDMKLLPR